MSRLLIFAFTLLAALVLSFRIASAQDIITDTVDINIDGITRTLTVTFAMTGVVSVDVETVTDTFKVTATEWLDTLNSYMATSTDITKTHEALDSLLTTTEETPYPDYWTPFVRQYRFSIHVCRDWLQFQSEITEDTDGVIFAAAPLTSLRMACVEQYQDAYVEMERIAHPRISPLFFIPKSE